MPPQPIRGRHGVTLIEMLIVVALLGLLAGITFPSVSSGLDSLRLRSASESIASFINSGMNRAARRQVVVEVAVSKVENAMWLRSTEAGWVRKLEMPAGISIVEILPPVVADEEGPRRFLLYPGGTPPRFAVGIANPRGARRVVRLDPITGVPNIEGAATP